MKSVLTPLAKSVLIPLRLSAGMSAADAAIQIKIYGLGTKALIISNGEMEDIMRIVKSLAESGLLIKVISEIIKNELKKAKNWISFSVIRNFSCYYIRKCITKERGSKSR